MAKKYCRVAKAGKHVAKYNPGTGEITNEKEFTPEYLRAVAEAGNELIASGALIPIPPYHTANGAMPAPLYHPVDGGGAAQETMIDLITGKLPAWNTLENQGFVTGWIYGKGKDDKVPWLWAEVDAPGTEDDITTPLGRLNKLIRGTSIGIAPAVPRPNGGEPIRNAPIHLAFTNQPANWEQGGFEDFSPEDRKEVVMMSQSVSDPLSPSMYVFMSMDTEEVTGAADVAPDAQPDSSPENADELTRLTAVTGRLVAAMVKQGYTITFDGDVYLVLEKVVTLLENEEDDLEQPFGPPPEKAEQPKNEPTFMSQADTQVQALLSAMAKPFRNALKTKADSLVATKRVSKEWADANLFPQIESITAAPVLMSQEGTVLLEDGEVQLDTHPLEVLMDGLASSPSIALDTAASLSANTQQLPADLDQPEDPAKAREAQAREATAASVRRIQPL